MAAQNFKLQTLNFKLFFTPIHHKKTAIFKYKKDSTKPLSTFNRQGLALSKMYVTFQYVCSFYTEAKLF